MFPIDPFGYSNGLIYLCFSKLQPDNLHIIDMDIMVYRAPQAKVVEINMQSLLCLSDPSVNGWQNGSDSEGEME